jgi:hypothetical protein
LEWGTAFSLESANQIQSQAAVYRLKIFLVFASNLAALSIIGIILFA